MGPRSTNETLLTELERRLEPDWPIDVVVFPAVRLLGPTQRERSTTVKSGWARRTCAPEPSGAFTGQVSASMLKDVGCRFVIVGHSERRRLYHEDDALVARKFGAVLQVGLTPVLCVGETLEEHRGSPDDGVVARQLEAVTAMNGVASFTQAIVAYEPFGR